MPVESNTWDQKPCSNWQLHNPAADYSRQVSLHGVAVSSMSTLPSVLLFVIPSSQQAPHSDPELHFSFLQPYLKQQMGEVMLVAPIRPSQPKQDFEGRRYSAMLFPICLLGKAELYYLSTYSLTFAALKLPTRVVYCGALISEGF